ncbi:MAG: transporter substrate-binding domain-containing protein [Chloroflexi bacterium]|nr:transporter substrate-binding domain-containing protein [Chloroflexota bacterium]
MLENEPIRNQQGKLIRTNSIWVSVRILILVTILFLAVACSRANDENEATAVPPTPTRSAVATDAPPILSNPEFVVVATDAPNPPFAQFDPFGNVSGFVEQVMAEIAATADLEYEFVVTPHEGVLESIAAGSNRDFDAVLSNLIIPNEPEVGIVYTEPYLEIGQVMVVLVDEDRIQTVQDIQSDMLVGVSGNSHNEETARTILTLPDSSIANAYLSSIDALQALINEEVTAVIIENYTAEYYVQSYPDRLKIVGGNSSDAWITSRKFGIAVAADNLPLLTIFNDAIIAIRNRGTLSHIAVELIPDEPFHPGESRAGTPADELYIGMLGQPVDLDPAGSADLISWEIKSNTMSGLFMFNTNNELVPMLATSFPIISEDKLEYTISLRQGVHFSDGSEFTADDVKWSVDRARSLGSFQVNGTLKDSDSNGFADDDAVQVIDQYTVKFVLDVPISTFLSLLATPPYYPISNECYAQTWDLESDCGGIGPYTISEWAVGNHISLQANSEWPGRPIPAFDNIVLRFYDDVTSLRSSLEKFQSIDLVWTGFPYPHLLDLSQADADGDGLTDYRVWEGPAIFKSYLIFDHDVSPWDKRRVRLAAAYAIDRAALAALFDGNRTPLLSPVPDDIPGYTAVYPARNLPQARALLLEEGFSQTNPAVVELWFVNDGRYSNNEEAYANAIKAQLEETGVFQVTLQSAGFEEFRGQIGACGYPMYLLGWPTPGQPAQQLDVTSWTNFFVENTNSGFCSNYDNEAMLELVTAAEEETNEADRLAIYGTMQQVWAEAFPTLDLLQEKRFAISLPTVENVQVDAQGILHYESLTKRRE